MIERERTKRGDQVKVKFLLADDGAKDAIAVVGDFNGWNPGANVMRRRAGRRVASLTLNAGRRYHFRYLTNSGVWFNDAGADGYERNEYGQEDSVLDLT